MSNRSHRVLWAALVLLAGAAPAAAQVDPPRLRNKAELARQTAALYPAALRDSAVEGEVTLRFQVLVDSTVDPASITVLETSHDAFAEPAIAAARTMRFVPARSGGQPVAVWIQHPVTFRIATAPGRPGPPTPPEEGTYELSAIEEMPSILNGSQVARQIEMRYPPLLRDASVSGDVVLRFRVLENGTVDSATVTTMLATHVGFEAPAITVVRQMRFRPARVRNRPVKVWVELPIHFAVERPEEPAPPATPPASPQAASPAGPGT